jgi:DNA-binding NtrC family response regulator
MDGNDDRLETVIRLHVEWVLQQHEGKKKEAAKALGIGRTTLYRMLKKWKSKSQRGKTNGTAS